MVDPWTARNWTKAGREQAQKELHQREVVKALAKKRIFPPNRPAQKPGTGYQSPKPFWES